MRPIVLRQKIRDYLIRTADNTRARRSVFRRLWRRREALVKLKNIAQLLSLVSSLQAMIAGFPGETQEDFDELCEFEKEIGFTK